MQSAANLPVTQPQMDVPVPYDYFQSQETVEAIAWFDGKLYAVVKDQFSLVVGKVSALAQGIFTVLSNLIGDTNTLASVLRKMNRHIIKGVEHFISMPGYLNKIDQSFRHAVGLIDFFQVFTDLDYFYNCKYKKAEFFDFLSKISVTVADMGGALLWLEEMSFIHLSSIAQSIAEVRVFSFVPKVVTTVTSLAHVRPPSALNNLAARIGEIRIFSFITKTSMLFIATRALTLTYIFLAIDAAQRIMHPGTQVQKTQASLDFAAYLSELVLDALMTLSITDYLIMGATGSLAIALVIASFAHKLFHAKELKQAELIKNCENIQTSCAIT